MRPRQARYQAALRPDKNCSIILKHYATLLQRGTVLLLAGVREQSNRSNANAWLPQLLFSSDIQTQN